MTATYPPGVELYQDGSPVDSVNALYVNIGGGSVTINATIPATVTAIGGGGSMSVGAAAGALGVASANATAPLAAQLMVSDGTSLQRVLAPLALGNGVNGNNMVAAADWLWNGASWDKARGDSIGGAVVSVSGGVITVSGGAGSSTVTVAAATINAATITGGSVSISGTPTVALSASSTVTATLSGAISGTVTAQPTGTTTVTGNVGVTSLPALNVGTLPAVSIGSGAVSQAGAWGVTATPSGTNTVRSAQAAYAVGSATVTSGTPGAAVTVFAANAITQMGYIKNPSGNAEPIFVDPIAGAGTVDGAGGSTVALFPGESMTFNPTTGVVTANSITASLPMITWRI